MQSNFCENNLFSLRKISKDFVDYVFEPSSHIRCRILEQPGLWMQEEELNKISSDIKRVAAKSTSEPLTYGVFSDNRKHLENIVITILYDIETQTPFAFNCLAYMQVELGGAVERVVHLGLVMVDPGYRKQGASWVLYGLTSMILFFRNQFKPIWVSNVTQVPAVFGKMCEAYDQVFPSPLPGSRKSFAHYVIATEMMKKYRSYFGVGEQAQFDSERFVMTDSYQGGSEGLKKSFSAAQKHRNDIYNKICQSNLDYERGDDFLQIGQITLHAAKEYLLRNVPRKSLLAVLYQVLFATISSVLLPIIHWFSAKKQMGDIRPW